MYKINSQTESKCKQGPKNSSPHLIPRRDHVQLLYICQNIYTFRKLNFITAYLIAYVTCVHIIVYIHGFNGYLCKYVKKTIKNAY